MSKLVMLRKTDEFSSVFSFKRRNHSHFLVVHSKPNTLNQVRIGFVVAKKTAKLAVDRNYMRRVLRELCRSELHLLNGVDIVIQVKKLFKNTDFSTIKQEVSVLFAKIQHQLVNQILVENA